MRRESAITVTTTGSNIATTATSASAAIPVTASGARPNYIRIVSTAAAYVKIGITAPTAAAGDVLVQPGDSVVLSVGGCGFVAAVQVAAAGIVNIVPLEDIG
jgi:hypothetical protein